ncbi:MAG TPA: S8 family serine peptidase [Ignavibacteria bacterium]|nr:S8 family serine peptidase [Ignavibacteria bacterium]
MKKDLSPGKIIFYAIFSISILSLLGSNNFSNQYKISSNVMSEMNMRSNDEKILVWISFSDKGSNTQYLLSHPELYLTQKSIDRRKKVKPANALVDYTDIPLNSAYTDELKNSGLEIKNRSKWFNRISCFATKVEIERMINNNFVSKIDLVKTFSKSAADIELTGNNLLPEEDNSGIPNNVSYQLNYGSSLTQMDIINAPMAHDSGYKGQGVLIALLDAGVDNLSHPAFDSLRARGIRTYDFVNHDTIVGDQSGQMGQGWHGTMTLSLVGGYRPGSLISPAFRSKYLIAKTENTDSETPLEEDNWIAAAEWADSLGADIITSSLGYIGMDGGSSHSYDWTWMNGDSCVITIGADLAVNKGIVVCNSAGNEGFNATHNTLGAPSDGDSVICVGSINSPSKSRSSFSSVGLTVDGRIKPDVCAMGANNYVAGTGAGNTGYTSGSGTSFSCPMTAGAVAVILSANPGLTPMQVLQILRQTADSSATPNRLRGWGLINTWEAVKMAKPKTLNLTVLAEGLYDAGLNSMISDTVRVYLRSNVSPYGLVDSAKGKLNTSGAGTFTFYNAISGNSYYLQISHRNALETWSKSAQTFGSVALTYNFTSDSAKAYGNNLKKIGSRWTIFSGDVLSNGVIELSDVIQIYNDASNFETGYIISDVNGDNAVDLDDILTSFNNSANFVSISRP